MPLTLEKQPLVQVVKSETAYLHQQVEEILVPKLRSIESINDYAVILQMFYGYFQPVGELIYQYITPAILPDVEKRRTTRLIIEDLKEIGVPTSSLVLCQSLPFIHNIPSAFGALYVLEGSTLGGKVIARMMEKNSAIPDTALQFFSGYKEETGPMWMNFVQVLNSQSETGEIVHAANQTFSHLKNWMQSSLIHE